MGFVGRGPTKTNLISIVSINKFMKHYCEQCKIEVPEKVAAGTSTSSPFRPPPSCLGFASPRGVPGRGLFARQQAALAKRDAREPISHLDEDQEPWPSPNARQARNASGSAERTTSLCPPTSRTARKRGPRGAAPRSSSAATATNLRHPMPSARIAATTAASRSLRSRDNRDTIP